MLGLKSIVSAAYKPSPPPHLDVKLTLKRQNWQTANVTMDESLGFLRGSNGIFRIGVIFPTYVSRCTFDEFAVSISNLAIQLLQTSVKIPDLEIIVFIGVQWQSREVDQAKCLINKALEIIGGITTFFVVGAEIPVLSKNITLDYFFKFVSPLGLEGMLWIDDDIVMSDNCISNLLHRFLKENRCGAFGARKIPTKKKYNGSKFLYFVKKYIKSENRQYPHGCCMIVSKQYISDGIPERFMGIGEDGYFCFLLLDPKNEHSFAQLTIVEDAICYYCVGGPFRELYPRLKRTILHTLILMGEFPAETSIFYFKEIWFYGLWPVAAADDKLSHKTFLRYAFKLIYFIWVIEVYLELYFRSKFNYPLRGINWSAYSHYVSPKG